MKVLTSLGDPVLIEMRLSPPELRHPTEVYQAIITEHGNSAERLGARMEHLGWSLADAAWAVVNWPPVWLAAAVACERERRGMSLMASPPRKATPADNRRGPDGGRGD